MGSREDLETQDPSVTGPGLWGLRCVAPCLKNTWRLLLLSDVCVQRHA